MSVMFWAKKSKNKISEKKSKAEQLYAELIEADNKCKDEQKSAQEDIQMIKKWAQELILDIYEVPKKYWYNELQNYQIIKYEDVNKNINPEIIRKTDEVIKGYSEQIKLREAKLKFCESLSKRYAEIKSKLETARANVKQSEKDKEKMYLLDEHLARIEKMNHKDARLEAVIEKKELLKFIDNDMKEIEDEFKFKIELQKQMNALSSELNQSDSESINTYISALAELNSEISKNA